jgi:hypothetical protein
MWLDCTAGSTALEIAVGAKWPRGGGESQALLAAGARPAGQEAREEAEATRELLKEKIDHDL